MIVLVVLLAALSVLLAVAAWQARLRAGVWRRASAAERAELDLLRKALDHVQEGVVLVGPGETVLYANPAAVSLLGAAGPPEPRSAPPLARFTPRPEVRAALASGESEETARQVVETEDRNGETGALEVTTGPAGPGRRFLVIRDLRAADWVDRKRRDFVANASHELQTPIAAVVGYLDLLETLPDGPERRRLLQRAQHNAQSLAELTRDLLGLARAQDPEWRPAPSEQALGAVFQKVCGRFEQKAADKGLKVEIAVEPADLQVLADPVALETVVANLVDNAVSYTDKGAVRVGATRRPGLGAVLEVRDTGPGIDPQILPRIFERFFRGDPARSRATGGTGLGLSIVRNLVRRMGGRISVATSPGHGATFRVELPVNPAQPLPGAGQAEFK